MVLTDREILLALESKQILVSPVARLGVGVHVTAPTIHAGFRGQVMLEMYNLGSWKVRLETGMPICQLIFEQTLGTPNAGYAGQFQEQFAR